MLFLRTKQPQRLYLDRFLNLVKDRGGNVRILENLANSKFNSVHVKLFKMKDQDIDDDLSYGRYVSKEIKDAVMKRFELNISELV